MLMKLCETYLKILWSKICQRFTSLMIFILIMGPLQSQLITYNANDASLETVLKEVKVQTGYHVLYQTDQIRQAGPVRIDAVKMSLETFLDKVLQPAQLSYSIQNKNIIISQKKNTSPLRSNNDTISYIDVQGIVKNANGEPIENVTITIMNTKLITVSDASGIFHLKKVPVGSLIEFSHVSMQNYSTRVTGIAELKIVMQANVAALKSVSVSTGYQKFLKDRANGSFEVIDSSLINRVPGYDIMSRLDGQAGSIFFNKGTGAFDMTIRGISTFTATISRPLIVVDNFPFDSDISLINPNDVEQVTILKDASAASIWGASAGNGVIVITTKKGKWNSRPKWKFTSNMTIVEKPDIHSLPVMNSKDFIGVEEFLFAKGFYNTAINNRTSRPVLSPVVEWLQLEKTGAITSQELDKRIASVEDKDIRDDYERYLYQPALFQQYHLQLSGGSEKLQYILTGGYDRQKENTVGDLFERFTFRIDNTYKPLKNLEIDASLFYSRVDSRQNGLGPYANINPGGGKTALYPYAQLADDSGNPIRVLKDYRYTFIDTAGGGKLMDWTYNPLKERKHYDNSQLTNHLLGRVSVRYQILRSLSAEVQYQIEQEGYTSRFLYTTDIYTARNLINRYSVITGNAIQYNLPKGQILNQNFSNQLSHQGRVILNYQLNSSRHQLVSLASAEMRQVSNSENQYRTYGYDDEFLTYSNVDYVTSFPIYANLSGPTPIPNSNSFGRTLQRYLSFFSNATYTYLSRYSISGSARYDGSNLFGVKTNQRFVPLWSVGTGWTISNEQFYHVSWLPFLKLRATYGVSGNSNNAVTAYSTIRYFPASGNDVNLRYAGITTPANPDLQWEQVRMMNIGIDFYLSDRRLSGSFEYYNKWSDNLLASSPLDPTTGYTSATFNSGKMEGTGFESSLNMVWIQKKIQWSTNLLLNYNKSKVTKYDLAPSTANNYVNRETTLNPLVGKEPFGVFAYQWGGLTTSAGDPIGYLDGNQSVDYTRVVTNTPLDQLADYGSARPSYFGSIRNTVQYKGWSLSANIIYQLGFYFRSRSIDYNSLYNSWATNSDFSRRWQKPGDELTTHVPSMPYPSNSNRDAFYLGSTVLINRADLIRLQDIRIDYAFSLGKSSPVKLQLYAYANNLGLIWKANNVGIDPTYPAIPASKSFTFGAQFIF